MVEHVPQRVRIPRGARPGRRGEERQSADDQENNATRRIADLRRPANGSIAEISAWYLVDLCGTNSQRVLVLGAAFGESLRQLAHDDFELPKRYTFRESLGPTHCSDCHQCEQSRASIA